MPLHFAACVRLSILLTTAIAGTRISAQNVFSPGGPDYLIAGARVGDQTAPQAALGTNGGWLVWQDNSADGDGLGIAAAKLDAGFNRILNVAQVNQQAAGDQEKPQVALLPNGGAVVVWQGGRFGFQKIYARFLNSSGTFATGDILVNTYTNFHQITPAVTTLADGDVIVVWSSFQQDGDLLGIYGQRLTAAGQKVGAEFRINQTTPKNQRTPSVAALTDGRFVVAWVTELQRGSGSVDIAARLFDASGTALGNEFFVNPTSGKICANPSLAPALGGGFAVAWSQKDSQVSSLTAIPNGTSVTVTPGSPSPNSWDVFGRLFDSTGAAIGGSFQLNTVGYGDQYAPRLSAFGKSYLATWVSLGQDGAREGVYAQFFNSNSGLEGVEFRVNTVTASRQIHPAIASDGHNRFLVVWTTFQAGTSFDLMARSYELIRTEVGPAAGGLKLTWNTQPGSTYQVQVSAALDGGWANSGGERTATGMSDSLVMSPADGAAYFRVVRVR